MTQKSSSNRDSSIAEEIRTANIALIEWSLSIYGIYWGIWLSFFVEQIVQHKIRPGFEYFYSSILIFFGLLVMVYSYYLVKWLWDIRSLYPKANISELIYRLKRAFSFLIGITIATYCLGYIFCINDIWVYMGIWSSAGWFVLTVSIVVSDWRAT